ncbi:MAG: hypothetical protein JWQ66_394 [Mucilaginibacter sp.]|nr:hypothetical protein [Mucilaginibacter sp.]
MRKIKYAAKIIALPILVLLALQVNCFAQATDQIAKSFNQYQQATAQEKVFIHTDKSTYLPGEILWFKVYCVEADTHKPFNLSKVVYVDVLDNNKNALLQAKIAMKNGVGSGSLYIPVSVSNGSYKLRAYTNWMKNFSPDYYFEKQVNIINPLRSPDAQSKETAAYDVQFFPEGGNLIAGISSKVAFKVTAPNGKGLSTFRGTVIDQHNDTVARFQPLKFGIGSFTFTPIAGNTYKAIVKTGDGSPVISSLPAVNSGGYVMQLKDNGSQLNVTVNSANAQAGEVYLFAHTGQTIKTAMAANSNAGSASFTIDKNKLGDGVSHITIFNSARQPVCERLYFKRPKQQLSIEATADQPQYTTRKKVNISIAANISGKLTPADLSMSVYRIDSLQQIDAGDIYSYLWLRSDLRGNIEDAAYYFKNPNTETDEALDNLMLSQGWRKFKWTSVLSNARPAFSFLPEYNDHLITAKITNITTGSAAKNIVAYLSVPGKRVQLYTSQSDSAGRLLFNTKELLGPGEIVAQTNTERDTGYRIDVLSPFSEQYSKYTEPEFNLVPSMQKALAEHSLGTQVQNLYAGNKIRRFYDGGVDSAGFYGKPYKTYLLDNYTRFTTMEEVLREYIREVNVVRSQKRFHIKVLNDRGFLDGDPLVLLDDVPVFNMDKVLAIDPLKVKKLEVIRERYFYGATEAEGILSFTTYKGDLGGVEMDNHAIVLDYEGMQLHRAFYSPLYDAEASLKSRIPDFRNLLFWAPDINTGSTNKSQLSFYTSDQKGKYIGLIQGITQNGDAGSQYFGFEVK